MHRVLPASRDSTSNDATCAGVFQAAQVARAEQSAELAEFDEEIPWDEREAELKQSRDQELSRLEQELAMLEKEVSRVQSVSGVCT